MSDKNKKRETYGVIVKFKDPQTASITIDAESEEHAKELVSKGMEDKIDLEIIDIYNLKCIEQEAAIINEEPSKKYVN